MTMEPPLDSMAVSAIANELQHSTAPTKRKGAWLRLSNRAATMMPGLIACEGDQELSSRDPVEETGAMPGGKDGPEARVRKVKGGTAISATKVGDADCLGAEEFSTPRDSGDSAEIVETHVGELVDRSGGTTDLGRQLPPLPPHEHKYPPTQLQIEHQPPACYPASDSIAPSEWAMGMALTDRPDRSRRFANCACMCAHAKQLPQFYQI